ncbi:MAG: 50S ribosomal protein L6 [Planctomycetes bacterium ADurb.Bin126]|nr:MAG: 50S ribosomal protein L6 [Planctomycetes bacterium ADurb.Bin126]
MSRIGKLPIAIPDKIKVAVNGLTVSVEGPIGKLSWTHRSEISVQVDEAGKKIIVARNDESRQSRALHGLTRSLIQNMIEGCSKGFSKSLEVYGVGYGVALQGNKFTLTCGLSHPVVFDVPAGLKIEVKTAQARGDSEPARFTISGADKQMVGELAARVRKVRKPEPYKGKGVRYAGEHVRRKVGKAFAGAGG